MAELKIGTEYTIKAQVTEPMTARQMGSGQAEVLATPSLLALMEQAAWKSVAPMLEEGQSTVGTFAALKHLAATPLGMQVRVTARLTAVDRRKLSFFIEAFDAAEKVAEAEHERFVIDSAKFMAKAESKKQCE
jgi:fluoroacetyl-CoA thioesterase